MKKTTPRLIVCGILIGLLLALIWGNSCLNGETSGQFSGWVGKLISGIFPFLSPDSKYGHFILRKLGHFSEFAALGLCLSWLCGMLMERKVWMLALPLISGMAVAAVDETIQIFTPGRYSTIVDVGIDSCGALAGIIFFHLMWLLLRKLRHKREC